MCCCWIVQCIACKFFQLFTNKRSSVLWNITCVWHKEAPRLKFYVLNKYMWNQMLLMFFAPSCEALYIVGVYEFSHAVLLDVWSNNRRDADAVNSYILENIEENYLTNEQKITISKKVNQFIVYVNKHLTKCNRMLELFKWNHSLWLASKIVVVIEKTLSKPGQKQLTCENAGP